MTDETGSGLSPTARDMAEQVFVVSAAMVGVCLTLVGLVGIISSLNQVATLADELLSADALVFLVSCMSAYLAMRSRTAAAARYARAADLAFIAALIAIVAIGAIVTLHLL